MRTAAMTPWTVPMSSIVMVLPGCCPSVLFLPPLAPAPLHLLLDQHVQDLAWHRLGGAAVDGAHALGIKFRLTVYVQKSVCLLGRVGQLGIAEPNQRCGGQQGIDEFLVACEQLVSA